MIASAPFSSARKTPLTQILTFFALFAILFSLQARADSVIETVRTGTQPEAFAFNPATKKLYVANAGSDSVTVIDGSTNAVIDTITVGNNPRGIAVDSVANKIYVTNYDGHTVTVINGINDKVVSTVGVGTNPLFVAVNEVTGKVYVANQGRYNVTVIDGTKVTPIQLGMPVDKFAVNPAINRVYTISREGWSAMTIINGEDDSASPIFWLSSSLVDIAVNTANNRVYVAGDTEIFVLDSAGNEISYLGGFCCYVSAFAVNPANNNLYLINRGATTVINGSYFINRTDIIDQGYMAVAVAVNSATNQIYVANWDTNNVTVIDGGTNATSSVTVGINPAGILVDPATSRIYVRNQGSGSVSIIDGERPVRISSSQTPAPNSFGFNNTNVTVSFAATDKDSRPICTLDPVTLTTDGISQVASATCTDAAGNSATINHPVSIDKTPPVLTLSAMPKAFRISKGESTAIPLALMENLSGPNLSYSTEARILNSAGVLVNTIQGTWYRGYRDKMGNFYYIGDILWGGRDSSGAFVPSGTYTFEAQGIDLASNKSNMVSGTIRVK